MSYKKKLLTTAMAGLLTTGCIDKDNLAFVGDAENILFASNGDVFVTGGESVYRLEKNAGGDTPYTATSLYNVDADNDGEYDRDCSFTGIAQHENWIFTLCAKPYIKWSGWTFKAGVDTRLMAAELSDGDMEFKRLDEGLADDPLDILLVPNGLAFTPNGKLLIANENFFGQGSIGRISLDYSGDLPSVTGFEKDWIGSDYGVNTPNGVRVADNKVYLSDGNKVRRLYMDENYNIPYTTSDAQGNYVSNLADENVVYTGGILIDDIMPYCGGVAATKYFEGQLVYIAEDGEAYHTAPLSFSSPSSLAVGQGSGFDGYDLLVTEKGIITDNTSQTGNQVSRVISDIDLLDSATCAALQEI